METKLVCLGMHCEHCESRVEKAINELNYVESCKADHNANLLIINSTEEVNIKEIKQIVKKLGFKIK